MLNIGSHENFYTAAKKGRDTDLGLMKKINKDEFELDKKHYPTAFLLVIAIALYFMYGDIFSLKNVDFVAYKEVCNKYQSARAGTYTDDEILGLVNKVNYLLPGSLDEIKDPLKKEIKICANELSKRLSH